MENFENISTSSESHFIPEAAKNLIDELEGLNTIDEETIERVKEMINTLRELQEDKLNELDQDSGIKIALTKLVNILTEHEENKK